MAGALAFCIKKTTRYARIGTTTGFAGGCVFIQKARHMEFHAPGFSPSLFSGPATYTNLESSSPLVMISAVLMAMVARKQFFTSSALKVPKRGSL